MSMTIQVFAARNTDCSGILAVLPELATQDLHEENGWTWFVASALEVGSERLSTAMHALSGPVLLATLYDFECWTLRLHGEGHLPFEVCYEFGKLLLDDPAEEEPEPGFPGQQPPPEEPLPSGRVRADPYFAPVYSSGAPRPLCIDSFLHTPARLGLPLPEELVAELRREKPIEAIDSLLEWVVDEMLDALEDFGLPHDPDVVDAILLGDDVTDGELETPEGNLPRFLVALGMTQGWKDLVEQAAGDDEGPLDELGEAMALREDLDHILQHSAKRPPQPLRGGPLLLPLEDLDLLVRVGWFCSHMVGAVVGFELPAGVTLDAFPYALDWTPRGRGARTPIYPGDFQEYPEEREAMAYVLSALPEGSIISLWFGDDTYTVAQQCYNGVRTKEGWRIDASVPGLEHAVLRDALALARVIQRGEPLLVESPLEFQQACEISLQTGNVEQGLPSLDGLTVKGDEDARVELAVALFRLRFASQWDTAAVQQDELREAIDYYEELDEFFGKMAVPFKPDVLFTGDGRSYHEPDLDSMEFNGNRERALRALARCADLVRQSGYVYVGNLYCSTHPFEFMRLHLTPDGTSMLIELGGQLGGVARELVTEFESGSILVTSSLARRYSIPDRGILAKTVDDPALERLCREHEEGCRRMAPQSGAPRKLQNSLTSLAEALEHMLFRMEGPGTPPEAEIPPGGRIS